ncbi:hypothetical protein QJS10_CPA08g00486 [Acorus calamus]|uniref:Uncharacterized protein n=1 Tax=Acorus calamus TaxID=4465 RepID=A0AAV9EAV4_ACOCL|nr:hypothetical protein QJS10_CPA08g00486 [Acorus calamus]
MEKGKLISFGAQEMMTRKTIVPSIEKIREVKDLHINHLLREEYVVIIGDQIMRMTLTYNKDQARRWQIADDLLPLIVEEDEEEEVEPIYLGFSAF